MPKPSVTRRPSFCHSKVFELLRLVEGTYPLEVANVIKDCNRNILYCIQVRVINILCGMVDQQNNILLVQVATLFHFF